MLKAKCPLCEKEIEVKDIKVKCPSCKQTLAVKRIVFEEDEI